MPRRLLALVIVLASACGDGEPVRDDAAVVIDAATTGDAILPVPDATPSDAASPDAAPPTPDARPAGYTVATTAAAYQAITPETPIAVVDPDDGVGTVNVPFSFELYGAVVTTLQVSPNGFAATSGLTDPGGALNTTFPMSAVPNGILAPWWEDLTVDESVVVGASLSHAVQGTAPDRVLVVQWRNVRVSAHSTTNHRRFNFQLALFETTNVIEYRYGETASTGNPPTATSASVGIEDQTGATGENLLPCTPACGGTPAPTNPNGFPRATLTRLTPS
jgi:hypothetical protein